MKATQRLVYSLDRQVDFFSNPLWWVVTVIYKTNQQCNKYYTSPLLSETKSSN